MIKKSTKYFLVLLGILVSTLVCAASYYFYFNNQRELSRNVGELIVMDELSLWSNPANSGISYDSYEPLRVQRKGAEYFWRDDYYGPKFSASGRRYGEIRLMKDNGGIVYLPRMLSYNKADYLQLFLRQSSSQGEWCIDIYLSPDKVARVMAASPAVQSIPRGDWVEVKIKLSDLEFADYSEKKKFVGASSQSSEQYRPLKDYFYGIGFSLIGGKAKESLFIDRISLFKAVDTSPSKLTGSLEPPILDATVVLRTDAGDRISKVKSNGSFEVDIPAGAKVMEVVAQTDQKVMSPITGRFIEVGTYIPKLVIPTTDKYLKKSPGALDSNDGLYVYEKKYGPRLEPLYSFQVQAAANGNVVMAAELSTNKFGYIDRDRDIYNKNKAYRVMVLGECHHMGVHIAQAESWWNEAEAVAAIRTKRPVEIISASFNHASWTSSWPAYRDLGKELSPDITLLPIVDPGVLNLVSEEYIMDWLGASKGHRPAYQFELEGGKKLVHKPNDPDWQLFRKALPESERLRIRNQYISSPYVHSNRSEEPNWVKDSVSLSIASIKEFAKLAKARKSRFAVLYISNYGSSKKYEFTENGVVFNPNLFPVLMKKIAEESGVEFIDISTQLHMSMNGKDANRMFYASNGHFTPYAHYRYGVALGELAASWAEQRK